FKADGSTGQVELYHYGTKRFETTSTGAQVTGNLNVTGVLTYDDVTNIDSLGIVTARTGVDVNAGGINVDGGGLNITGVSTFANDIIANGSIDLAGDIDVDGHTNLDNVSVSGVSTFSGNVILGDASSDNITLNARLNSSLIPNADGVMHIGTPSLQWGDLYINGHTELDNVSIGGATTISNNLNVTSSIDVGLDLDVDGHTNLDNVSIAGVVTATTFKGALEATSASFSSNIDANGDLDVAGDLDVDG
ncbi:MAG: hypothetical protein VXY93_15270, partial [Pseudomonadota bacterium]|nr:hypothetical protein [Pseudomonadota bacterium]